MQYLIRSSIERIYTNHSLTSTVELSFVWTLNDLNKINMTLNAKDKNNFVSIIQ